MVGIAQPTLSFPYRSQNHIFRKSLSNEEDYLQVSSYVCIFGKHRNNFFVKFLSKGQIHRSHITGQEGSQG